MTARARIEKENKGTEKTDRQTKAIEENYCWLRWNERAAGWNHMTVLLSGLVIVT